MSISEKLVTFVSPVYADNPIFTELNLTDEQQNLLMDKLIMQNSKIFMMFLIKH